MANVDERDCTNKYHLITSYVNELSPICNSIALGKGIASGEISSDEPAFQDIFGKHPYDKLRKIPLYEEKYPGYVNNDNREYVTKVNNLVTIINKMVENNIDSTRVYEYLFNKIMDFFPGNKRENY
jgi:hypothetical protein